jgi:dimethylhistidine N-methyltransferase
MPQPLGKESLPGISPESHLLESELMVGLTESPKRINPKFFYDEYGSQLFEEITRLPEYYPTRTEMALLESYKKEIAQTIGPGQVLLEPGAGNCKKVRLLLPALRPACFVPIDLSREYLFSAAEQLREEFPAIEILPVVDDMGAKVALPERFDDLPRTVFYPGSTIGNYQPDEAVVFLKHVREVIGEHGGLLVGVDLQKDPAVLHRAYNDTKGITALFNLNILNHINRLISADFDVSLFEHVAFYNERECRIEMHLESTVDQMVSAGGETLHFKAGERLLTEYSYKYTLEGFAGLAEQAGLVSVRNWVDKNGLFSLQYYRVA